MAKKKQQSFFRKLTLITLLLGANAVIFYLVYYGLRTNRLFGLKGYLDFSLPRCREPLLFKPTGQRTTKDDLTSQWQLYENKDRGYSLKLPPEWEIAKDWECNPEYRDGCFRSQDQNLQISALVVNRNFNFHGYKAVERFIGRQKFDDYFIQTLIDSGEEIYIFNQSLKADNQKARELMRNIISTFHYLPGAQNLNDVPAYNGIPSLRVPYKDLKFTEIDAYNTKDLAATFSQTDYHYQGLPVHGYTFAASKGDFLDFRVLWPSDGKVQRNLASVYTELYAYGPTVIKKEGVFDFEVPQTGRYFLMIKAKSDWKYKGYRLQIIKKS